MTTRDLLTHDIHVHTFLSSCSNDPAAVPAQILRTAAECGLKTVGFADHLWDAEVPGASDWYRPQDMDHIGQIRSQLPADTDGIRVLVGCETEYVGGGRVGISPAAAAKLDFVLVPHSHFHMEGFVRPAAVQSVAAVAGLLRERFAEAIELDVATGIAHPFLPCILPEYTDAILAASSDAAYADLFGRAAELGISLEITHAAFPSLGAGELEGWHDESFLRVYRLALEAGCVFHFASDTHSLAGIGRVAQLAGVVDALGLGPGHLHPLVRPAA